VKIGSRDAFAFPDLIPGSIVRVDQSIPDLAQGDEESESSSPLVLVRHGRGLVCTRIQSRARNRIVLCPTQLPYAPIELELQKEAAILGTADFEIRPLVSFKKPTVAPSLASYRPPAALAGSLSKQNFGHLIQRARQRLGLSFREASGRTRLIAQELGDSRYFCASSALSDYEAQDSPPRHIHKLISICAVYFTSPEQILQAAGISAGSLGQLPIPLRVLRDQTSESPTQEAGTSRFMEEMERLFRQIPYFLYRSIAGLFGLPKLSVRDVFWCGENNQFVHPSLSGAVLLVVDRRKKILRSNLSCPVWAQPLYIFLQRDGSFLCGSSTQSNSILSIRPCTAGLSSMLRLRNRMEVEVVGQIVGVVRRLRAE